MTEQELATATYWAGIWETVEHLAFFGVVLALAIEFGALKLAAPHKKLIEEAKDFQLGQLKKDTVRLTTEGDAARAAIADANARALEAQLALEKFRAPRTLSLDQQADIASKMSQWAKIPASGMPQSVAVFSIDSSFESATLADQIAVTLGPNGAKWTINRYPVTYGMSLSVSGVGILTSSNPRGMAVADELVKALNANGIAAFVIPTKRTGCEEIETLRARADTDPACSAISVMVGDHPR